LVLPEREALPHGHRLGDLIRFRGQRKTSSETDTSVRVDDLDLVLVQELGDVWSRDVHQVGGLVRGQLGVVRDDGHRLPRRHPAQDAHQELGGVTENGQVLVTVGRPERNRLGPRMLPKVCATDR
jgi:hypothetical protein